MNLQYITDSNGQTTGVFIPIDEWNELKNQIKNISKTESEVPGWHTEIVHKRMELLKNNPDQIANFDSAMDELEKEL